VTATALILQSFLAPVPATPFTFTFLFHWVVSLFSIGPLGDSFFFFTWVIIIKLYAISFFLSFYVCVFHLGWKTEKGLQASEKDGRATD
jgi:hypothetical protein